MFKNLTQFSLVFVLSTLAVTGLGCDVPVPGGGGPGGLGGGGGGGTVPFTIVKTDIDVRHDAALRAGDDLIAFGTGVNTGVSYIIPSNAPTVGTAVPNSGDYDSSAFAVGGDHIFLVGSNTAGLAFQMSVFDAATGAITHTFPTTDIRLGAIPGSEEDVGNIQADGDFCIVRCDQTTVTDGKIVKVIDASTNPPTLVSFATNPAASHFNVSQVDVDAASRQAVAVANHTFFIYDIDAPNAAPVQIAPPNGIGDVQIEIAGDYIIAIDNQGYGEAFMVDIAAQAVIALTNPEAAWDVAICDDLFAFFADADINDRAGGGQRMAVGAMPGPGSTKAALDQYIDGSTGNNGYVGFGGSMTVTPDGAYVFLSDGYLQYSLGTAVFVVPPDPNASDPYGTPAWDVHCTEANTVGFKTASDRSATSTTKVGYIVLP
ncbi:MAG: hypothetical protein ABII12_07205 [Planctomycetota bacterium]